LVARNDPTRDRLVPGLGVPGPRIVDFAPVLVLRKWNINDAVNTLLDACERALGAAVEIEFAATLDDAEESARVGFLQVRPLVVAAEQVEVSAEDLQRPDALVSSDAVDSSGGAPPRSGSVAERNTAAADASAPYVLIGFGRWGTSDPWLGIPATWPQVAGARVIVEATLPGFGVELSQGSHFFHNISSAGVGYFSVRESHGRIDWAWLDGGLRSPRARSSGTSDSRHCSAFAWMGERPRDYHQIGPMARTDGSADRSWTRSASAPRTALPLQRSRCAQPPDDGA
jgi:hypothetical protein